MEEAHGSSPASGSSSTEARDQINAEAEPYRSTRAKKGRTASQAQDVHKNIREILARQSDLGTAQQVRIQYGGSVKPNNVRDLMAEHDIDGALVGGASLTADSFVQIVAHREDAQ